MDQHKVPNLSLKHFAGPDGLVWTYNKSDGRHWSAVPERTSVEAHYYSVERADGTMDTSIENLLSETEGHAAPIYERLVRGTLPQGSDREIFGEFLALMFVRSPTMRRFMATVYKAGIESQMVAIARHPQAFAALLKQLERDGLEVSNPEFIRNSISDMSQYNLVLPKAYVLLGLGDAPKFAEIFLQMKWSVAHAEHHYFITCDNPIYRTVDPVTVHSLYGDGGLLNRTAQITFPISTKRLLLLNWEGDWSSGFELQKEYVIRENRKRALAAEREFYAHIKHKDLVKLADSFKEKRSEIRGGSLAGTKGFGKVVVPRRWAKS